MSRMETKRRICVRCAAARLASVIPCVAQQPPANQPDIPIGQNVKVEVVHVLAENLQAQYVFPDTADKLAQMLSGRLDRGEYASIHSAKEFAEVLTRQLREIAHDAHLQVEYAYEMPLPSSKPGQIDGEMLRMMKRGNYGFGEVKILEGNIGYLKMNAFADPQMGGETAAGVMAFLANTDAVIVDVRKNYGGNPGMVALLSSYFFAAGQAVHLGDLSMRKPGTTEHTVQQSWTLPYVPGSRYLDKELYILTSDETPSAAEGFAYDLKALKRATIVGERTWGGANPGKPVFLSDHFLAFIPFGQAINPVTKTNWEGTGVEPDITTPQADALKTAYIAALEHLIQKSNDEREWGSLKEAIQNAGESLK
jgi:retinol-binding protein 3